MKRPLILRILSLLLERSSGNIFLDVHFRIHKNDFNRLCLKKEKFEKGKFEFIYVYVTDINIPKGQEFNFVFLRENPLNYVKTQMKVLEIYDSKTGKERFNIEGFHNNCLVEFTEGVPSNWNRVAYVNSDYVAPKRMEYTFTNQETMSRIVKMYKIFLFFKKLEEESSDNIIVAIDSIATNENNKLPENLLQKENNAFVCIKDIRGIEVNKGTMFDVIFTLNGIYDFIECKTKIIDFYKEDGTTKASIPKDISTLEFCHLEFKDERPVIWKELCLETDLKEVKAKKEVLYLASNHTMLRLLELLEEGGFLNIRILKIRLNN
ncbi:hypothetical protein [Tenacibaculum ovolyticum]|uniref:hypothetical protein n=1 Tax=Tenacibaculum ovolyticum TaxID=104270 RepID=UPI00048EE305|nr:hypothetical protein [Tenacibaculum ovolyticum]